MKKYLLLYLIVFTINRGLAQTLDAEQIYKKVNDAVVQIYAYDSYSKILSQGSGVVLNDKGWIVTNYHVYNGSDKMVIKHNGKTIEYTDIIGVDADKDILILKISANTFPSINMGNSDLLNIGQRVYAIGSPMGFENTITEGIISGLRSYDAHAKNYIQISAAISHGSSGGAVVNSKGELIGISTLSVVEGQNLNFAIPVNEVIKIYKKEGVNKNDLSAADYFYKGVKLDDLGKYEEAIINYNKAIELNPTDADAYISRGISKKDLQDYRGAIADYTKAIELKPDDADAYYNRGISKGKLKDYRGAIADYTKSIELKPDYSDVYYNRGNSKGKLKDYRGAIADYTKSIELKPDYSDVYYNRGNSKDDLEDYRGAIADYTKSIELKPDYAAAYNNRGISKGKLKDYRGAVADFDKAIELKPDDADAYYNRGHAKLLLGQKDSGCLDLSKAGELGDEAAYDVIKSFCN